MPNQRSNGKSREEEEDRQISRFFSGTDFTKLETGFLLGLIGFLFDPFSFFLFIVIFLIRLPSWLGFLTQIDREEVFKKWWKDEKIRR